MSADEARAAGMRNARADLRGGAPSPALSTIAEWGRLYAGQVERRRSLLLPALPAAEAAARAAELCRAWVDGYLAALNAGWAR